MKLITLFVSLSIFLLFALPASGAPDLVGTWCVSMSSAYSQGTYGSAGFWEEEYEIEFMAQTEGEFGTLFYGQVEVLPNVEWTYFSGVLDGDEISMTHWDSVTRGKIKEKKGNIKINFVNNAFDDDDRRGKTSIGIAVKGSCPSS
jgi:hypothetical protein